MGLSDFLSSSRIMLGLDGCKKRELIGRLAEQFAKELGGDASAYAKPLLAREKLGSTAIGKGIALPHGKAECLSRPAAVAAVLHSPVNFQAPDGIDVDVVIAFLSPDGPPRDIGRIGDIVRELRSDEVRQAFRTADTPEEIMAVLARNEDG